MIGEHLKLLTMPYTILFYKSYKKINYNNIVLKSLSDSGSRSIFLLSDSGSRYIFYLTDSGSGFIFYLTHLGSRFNFYLTDS